jgi:hypothetical protein
MLASKYMCDFQHKTNYQGTTCQLEDEGIERYFIIAVSKTSGK